MTNTDTERQVALGVNKIPESMDVRIWRFARKRGLSKAAATRVLLDDALTRDEQQSRQPSMGRRARPAA